MKSLSNSAHIKTLRLAFLFFGLLKQINLAVEGKTIGAIFAPFSVSVTLFSGWPQVLKQKMFITALGE